ncbi:hypothetical protein GCM10009574_074390 [Streptomyces asiaticus]|uniref:Uncharacterized protein n=2 Tax=Streptomyces rhizosphaericus TaxID=114699 RepID=A0ABN1S725_9ACTN
MWEDHADARATVGGAEPVGLRLTGRLRPAGAFVLVLPQLRRLRDGLSEFPDVRDGRGGRADSQRDHR